MRIAVIGAGNMARGIATRLLSGGHTVAITARDITQAETLAADLTGDVHTGDDTVVDDAEIVVLAVPFAVAEELAASYGPRLSGKIVVDISNPVKPALDGLVTPPGTSAAAAIARAAGDGARAVKAFNTTFASTLIAGEVAGTPLDVFIAGDDETARQQVADLVAGSGLNPVDVGPLEWARALEGFQLLHMSLQPRDGGHGWGSTIKIVAP